eukprot:365122-Chlamydomonas_euryale.AAC.26
MARNTTRAHAFSQVLPMATTRLSETHQAAMNRMVPVCMQKLGCFGKSISRCPVEPCFTDCALMLMLFEHAAR